MKVINQRFPSVFTRLPVSPYYGSAIVSLFVGLLFPIHTYLDGYPIGPDASVFLFSGYVTARTDGITYLTYFDVKPPGIHLVSSALHLLPLDREGVYLVSVLLMFTVFVGIAAGIAYLVSDVTENVLAANVAPFALLTHEASATAWMHGPMGKYFIPLLVIVGIVALRRNRPYIAILCGALSAAFWQFAVILVLAFYLGAVAIVKREKQLRTALLGFGIMCLTTLLVTLPYILEGAGSQMIAQVVVITTGTAAGGGYGKSLYGWLSFLNNYDLATVVLASGIGGLGLLTVRAWNERDSGLIIASVWTGWIVFASYQFSQTGALDTIVLTPMIAIGLGVLVDILPETSLQELDGSLPDLQFQTGFLVILGIFTLLACARTFAYPPYFGAGNSFGMEYLAGSDVKSCIPMDTTLANWWRRSFGSPGETCRSLSAVFELLS